MDTSFNCLDRYDLRALRAKSKINKSPFFLASVITLIFSATQVQQCSDYLSYKQIYDASNGEFSLSNFFKVDTIFYNLSSLWQSLIDYKKYDLFFASYQTISITILVYGIYHFCGKWRNTILFLNLFGSLQFYHLTLCTLRQGLSSGFSVLLLILVFQGKEMLLSQSKITPFALNTCIAIITLLTINTHWTGVFIAMTIHAIRYFQEIRKTKTIRIIFTTLISFILLASTFSIAINKLNVYSIEAGTGYGEKIFLTLINDIGLILVIFYGRLNKLKTPDTSVVSICYLGLLIISSLLIFFKILTLFGFGVGLRVILGLTTLQLICLPAILNNANISVKLLIVVLMSTPYLVFIFVSSPERFIPVQSTLF